MCALEIPRQSKCLIEQQMQPFTEGLLSGKVTPQKTIREYASYEVITVILLYFLAGSQLNHSKDLSISYLLSGSGQM
jgi:hypothetical protein